MTTKTIREVLDDAAFRIDQWLDPSLKEFYSAWEFVFESTPGAILHGHKLEMINRRSADNLIYVVTNDGRNRVLLVIPGSIFDAGDPREAALDWRDDHEIELQRKQIALAERHKAAAQATLDRLLERRSA